MLKLFRKIRQQLLSENLPDRQADNFSKPASPAGRYLLYAVGEIILVVIGILIALQFNNWNEALKIYKAETVALMELKQEFIHNAQLFDKHIGLKRIRVRQWEAVIEQASQQILVGGAQRAANGAATFLPSQNTLNKLLFTGKIDNLNNEALKELLGSWNVRLADYQDDEKIHKDFWYRDFSPYEKKIIARPLIPSAVFSNIGNTTTADTWRSPFHTEQERKHILQKAYQDMVYQNLLLENRNHLLRVLSEGAELQITFQQIIKLLDEEIASRTN